jgi:hypothetical protein
LFTISSEDGLQSLEPAEGKMNLTKGGLRIGEKFNERKPNEPYSETLEW